MSLQPVSHKDPEEELEEKRSTTISQMFAKATKAFVKDTDHEGHLIPVSSLNDTDKLKLRSLIVKTRHRCFWQEPKYQSPGFTLGDVLKPGEPGNTPLSPTVKESDFVDYSGTFGDKKEMNTDGNVEAKLADFNITVGGKWSTKQKLSLGSLNKEKVDVKELHNYSKDRVLDMSHPVIKQTRVNPRAVLGVLTERITTSLPCPVTNNVQKRGNVGANVSACVFLSGKASMKQSGSTQTDSDVSLGIPANTVMAYSLIELYVKCNDLCLICNNGGFEIDKSKDGLEVDGIMDLGGDFDANSPLNLNEELEKLNGHFQLLLTLPAAKRSSLHQLLKTTMEDREAVSVLESVLDQMCDGETPDLGDLEESERETVQVILDLVDQCVGKDEDEFRSSLLSAIHLIVSAMDGMTDEGLSVLGSCCSPPVLQALQILVQHVAAGSGETLSLRDAGLAVLTEEEVLGRTESLFGHSKVTLKREEDTLRTEMKDQPGYLPLVMSITVKGLASLL
ncbi:gasdermin-E-like isoform X2 [Salmo trutta]|uniref:gasdermin-E-like isoform X2 n=1 Tax=Salmo trutta TaxID=8032 RepID=UPI00113074BA|nr:gasdermin-E-like isoform X2 [Salmo trutta]